MNISKLVFILPIISFSAVSQQYPVFQAQAGSVPQQQNYVQQAQQDNQQAVQQDSQQSAQTAQQNQTPQSTQATSSLNDLSNVPAKKVEKNEFLQFYTRQGGEICPSVFYQQGNSVVKRNISQEKLEKAVLVFFGDWCPHCHKFMSSFANAKNLEPLVKYGINVIFINIPSVDKLRKWEDPTLDEFNAVENKVSGYINPDGVGVSLTDQVSVTLLGDVATLQKSGIDGLPVVVAVKDGKEYYRGVGESCISKLQFTELNVLMDFLDIWNDKAIKEQAKEETGPKVDVAPKASKKTKTAKKEKKKAKTELTKVKSKQEKLTRVDIKKARAATESLNSDFGTQTKYCRVN